MCGVWCRLIVASVCVLVFRLMQFVTGRSRLQPSWHTNHSHTNPHKMTLNIVELPHAFTALHPTHTHDTLPLQYCTSLPLPKSQTCFSILDLPAYPNVEVMRDKLRRALECTEVNF